MNQENARVGIGVFVIKNGKFLIQLRHGSHDANTWCLPGGHLDFGESFEDTARREVKEETGLDISNVRFGAVTNDIFAEENKHYVTIWMLSDWKSGAEHITEPNKCLEQRWCTLESLPSPLFLPWNQLLESEFIEDIKNQLQAS